MQLSQNSKTRSEYLSYSFFGLSLIPIPELSILFGALGLGSSKLGEHIESSQYYLKGLSTKGLSAYYSFLESMVDVSKLEKFPDIQNDNNNIIAPDKPFWRS